MKVKEFVSEHKKEIALVVVSGIALGCGVCLYRQKVRTKELEEWKTGAKAILHDLKPVLLESRGAHLHYSKAEPIYIKDLPELANDALEVLKGRENDEITGLAVFLKRTAE